MGNISAYIQPKINRKSNCKTNPKYPIPNRTVKIMVFRNGNTACVHPMVAGVSCNRECYTNVAQLCFIFVVFTAEKQPIGTNQNEGS